MTSANRAELTVPIWEWYREDRKIDAVEKKGIIRKKRRDIAKSGAAIMLKRLSRDSIKSVLKPDMSKRRKGNP